MVSRALNRNITFLLIIALFASCSQKASEDSDTVVQVPVDLTGSWKLVERIDHENGKTEWESSGEEIIYEKHITPTHFTWVSYNLKENTLNGAGGGTYKVENGKYIESIEFFHPVGSGIIGEDIVFDVGFEEGVWYHTGMAKNFELDPETGDNIVSDSTKIEEKWVKIAGAAQSADMVKTWHLQNYKDFGDSTYNSYPEFVGYMKLLTPSRFVWVRYNNESNGGEVIGLGSGSWNLGTGTYEENIHLVYPEDAGIVGTTITFDYNMDEGKWYHAGIVNSYDLENKDVVKDSFNIDEIWVAQQD